MRLDKYLKVSRLIKRRTVAKEACDKGIISINDKVAKSSTVVSVGDVIKIRYSAYRIKRFLLSTILAILIKSL